MLCVVCCLLYNIPMPGEGNIENTEGENMTTPERPSEGVEPVEPQQTIEDLMAQLQVERATREALARQVEEMREFVEAATGVMRLISQSSEAQLEMMQLPERERPKDKAGWTDLIREQVTRLRDRGESPYSQYLWEERPEIKRILVSIPAEEKELLRDLINEVSVMQHEDRLTNQWKQRGGDFDPLRRMISEVSGSDFTTPDFLRGLSNLPEATPPPWLEEIIPPDQRSLSMQISRSIYLYTTFFGRWSELIAQTLDGPGGIEETRRKQWQAGKFGKDRVGWDKAVMDELEGVDWRNNQEMISYAKGVLEKLGFGSGGEISHRTLKMMIDQAPEDFKRNRLYQKLKERVETIPDEGGVSFLDLLVVDKIKDPDRLRIINMFVQDVSEEQKDYLRWLCSSLCGSSYAEESAVRFLIYTGETGKMNVLDSDSVVQFEVYNRLCNSERRRLKEARKNRPGGPWITLGRYPGLAKSWSKRMELTTEKGKKPIIEFLREGVWFHQLPWEQLGYGNYYEFLIPLVAAVGVFGKIIDRNSELVGHDGFLSDPEVLEKTNKEFQSVFKEWNEYEKREAWAKESLKMDLATFGRQKEWSPWFTFVFGLIYEHHPDQRIPEPDIQSPTGMVIGEKILPLRTWLNKKSRFQGGGAVDVNSIPDLLDYCEEVGFLTPTEKELLKRVCKI